MRNRICWLALVLILSLISCVGSDLTTDSLRDYEDSNGFAIRMPRGWKSEVLEDRTIVLNSRGDRYMVFIHPYLFTMPEYNQAKKKDQWAAQFAGNQFKYEIMEKYEFDGLSDEEYDEGPNHYIEKIGTSHVGEYYTLMTYSVCRNRSGMVYLLAASEEDFDSAQPVFMEMLESFRYTKAGSVTASVPKTETKKAEAPAPKAKSQSLRFVHWQDPDENAFSLEVPAGWNVKGGCRRLHAIDVRRWVKISSPDNRFFYQIGDPDIPYFTNPGATLIPEGNWYTPPGGATCLVKRYHTGTQFSQAMISRKSAEEYPGLTITESKNMGQHQTGMGVYDEGQVLYEFRRDGRTYGGLTQTITLNMGNQMWFVDTYIDAYGPEDQSDTANKLLLRILASYKVNPQWMAGQSNLALTTSQMEAARQAQREAALQRYLQTQNETADIIMEGYASKSAILDDNARQTSNWIRGETDVADPASGESWKVESGHNYYFRQNGTNNIVGSQTSDLPDIDFSPLEEF